MIKSEIGRNVGDIESEPSSQFPGSARLLTGLIGPLNKFILRVLMYPTSQGALTQLWAGTSPDAADLNGAVSISSLPVHNETYSVRYSMSSHGGGLAGLAATTQNLGESSGFGSRSRLRMSDNRWLQLPSYILLVDVI